MYLTLKTKNKERKNIMNKVISENIKTSIIEQVVFGDDVRDVAEKYHVSRASIYRWMKAYEYRQKYNTDNLLTLTQMKRNMDRANKKTAHFKHCPVRYEFATTPPLQIHRND